MIAGVGGFGEIYLCSTDLDRSVGEEASLACKIEPHENGPLFVEMNFYLRAAQPDAVEAYRRGRGLSSLGMPSLRGSGSHVHRGEKYRFLVMDRYGKDLQKVFQNGDRLFSARTTFNLALKIVSPKNVDRDRARKNDAKRFVAAVVLPKLFEDTQRCQTSNVV